MGGLIFETRPDFLQQNVKSISKWGAFLVEYVYGKFNRLTLTENQYAILLEIFQFVASMELYSDDSLEHTDYQFDELWTKVLDAEEFVA